MDKCQEIHECRLCKSQNITTVLDFGNTPLANSLVSKESLNQPEFEAPLQVYRCKECGSVGLKHTVNPEILFKNYLYASSTSAKLRQHFADYAESVVKQWGLKQGDLVIEVASNDNILLKPFKLLGMNVVGIEPATNIVEQTKGDSIKVYNEFFNEELAKKMVNEVGRAKVITANNVMAHVPNLESIVKGIKLLLAPDGVFIMENAYLLDTINGLYFDQVYHEHLFFHSIKPLKRFFRQFDLEIVRVERNSNQGGSFRAFVKHTHHCFTNWSSVEKCIILEEEAGLYRDEAYKLFINNLNNHKVKIKEILKNLKLQGKSISAYGAPAKLVTLLHFFNIDNSIIDFVIDDSFLKWRKFVPGKHIEIKPKEELLNKNPDYCILTAWNFADSIIKNNPDYKGIWIKILPNIDFISCQ